MLLSISTPWEKLAHFLNSVINGFKLWYPLSEKLIEALPRHDYFKKCQAQILLSFCLRVPLYSLPRKLSSVTLLQTTRQPSTLQLSMLTPKQSFICFKRVEQKGRDI